MVSDGVAGLSGTVSPTVGSDANPRQCGEHQIHITVCPEKGANSILR